MSENINATLRFMPLSNGKFTWKIYDDNGSVVDKAGMEFDSEDAARAHFDAWQASNSEEIASSEEFANGQNAATPAGGITANAEEPKVAAPAETAEPEVAAETTEAAGDAPVVGEADAAQQPVEQVVPEAKEGEATGSVANAGSANL